MRLPVIWVFTAIALAVERVSFDSFSVFPAAAAGVIAQTGSRASSRISARARETGFFRDFLILFSPCGEAQVSSGIRPADFKFLAKILTQIRRFSSCFSHLPP